MDGPVRSLRSRPLHDGVERPDILERLVPIDALASALLGVLMASLAVVLGHKGDVQGMLLVGGLLFGGLCLVHWRYRVGSDFTDDQ